jgi:hypothetical protein
MGSASGEILQIAKGKRLIDFASDLPTEKNIVKIIICY